MGDQPDRADQAGRHVVLPAVHRLTAAARSLARAGHALTRLVFPQRCLACGRVVDEAGALCPDCWSGLAFLGPPVCACCGFPFPYQVAAGSLCAACTARRPAYTAARSALAYDDASRNLVLAFKHGDHTHYAPAFGAWLQRAAAELLPASDWIVPVPLHRWRLFRRRFNQSTLLGRALSRRSGKPLIPDLLVRRRNTPPQGRLSRSQRRRNVSGAFAVREAHRDRLAGKRILLIDDVFTTGATVDACSRALLAAGAAEVRVVTLARVVRPRAAEA